MCIRDSLKPFDDIIHEYGCTVAFVHHTNKMKRRYALPELSDLAGVGPQQWAGGWMLINKRARFREETGEHRMHFRAGSRQGGGGRYILDVNEGPNADKWETNVLTFAEYKDTQAQEKQAKVQSHREKVLDVLKADPEPLTNLSLIHI